MQMPENTFKQAIRNGQVQLGLWVGFADAYVAEALATADYDWLLIDGEHAPNDLRGVLAQLQAIAPYKSHPVVRPPEGRVTDVKQLLDLGAQTLLIPMVETPEQAAQLVSALRYPPHGVRGVGSALARSSRWNQIDGYLAKAQDDICLLVQVESSTALSRVPEIAAVEGVDGVFFGPADLSASMDLLGQPGHPKVQEAIVQGIRSVVAAGKAAGVLSADQTLAKKYLGAGATFVAIGVDTTLLVRAAKDLLGHFRDTTAAPVEPSGAY
ncbi:4-hydroxy-2-oxoheptanedioate aldolase [Variovorax sp. VRV01]|uniref:4-hydroxy-2-oxoheptanedioate aldolase n=1 Tax=Variovorax sp. VRV01 TaxID=2769259 RepID=UPI00177CE910|nr:4-hydroxy-2-oxoheptanedioate aldolase [Variovorax sp. VRV01]MBD9668441.1 4-hydroxy-2-oxoheptanedioate aldolase [Variovorax sp. VRV01]